MSEENSIKFTKEHLKVMEETADNIFDILKDIPKIHAIIIGNMILCKLYLKAVPKDLTKKTKEFHSINKPFIRIALEFLKNNKDKIK